MTWQPFDCHAHTTFSDGALSVTELVETVRARGVRPSVSDHISGDVAASIKSVEEVRVYLEELERHDVARAGEFCWHDPLWRELPGDLAERFTHFIGSLHAVVLPGTAETLHLFGRRVPDGMTPDAYMEIHLDNLERLALEMPVDILAHPTLLPLPYRHIPLEEMWTEGREDRAVRALARSGIAFEVSSRYRAHERFVRRAHSNGVRLSLGSDGHTPDQVGDITFPLSLARAVGARDDDLYDSEIHGSRWTCTRSVTGGSRSTAA